MTVLETKNVYYRLFSVLPALENSLSARGLLFSLAYHSARILKAETAQVYLAGRAGTPAFLYASWSQDQITSINNRTINLKSNAGVILARPCGGAAGGRNTRKAGGCGLCKPPAVYFFGVWRLPERSCSCRRSRQTRAGEGNQGEPPQGAGD